MKTADYFAENDIIVADRFFDAFESTIEVLKRTPKIGSIKRYNDQTNVRMWFIKGFENILIFFTESNDEIVILRVIHAARDYTSFFDFE